MADNLYWLAAHALANTGDLPQAEEALEERRSISSKIGSKRVDDVDEVLLKVRELIHSRTDWCFSITTSDSISIYFFQHRVVSRLDRK